MNAAQIILQQLGGNKFIAMTGCKNFLHSNQGQTLTMDLPINASQARRLQITLNGLDLYDMMFFHYKPKTLDIVIIAVYNNIYDDQLQPIFTALTGLQTHL